MVVPTPIVQPRLASTTTAAVQTGKALSGPVIVSSTLSRHGHTMNHVARAD
eukprot:COSAG02_NODE_45710_length_354_cov_1.623529_1_plen_50_part_01